MKSIITVTALATTDTPLGGNIAVFLSGSRLGAVSLVGPAAGVALSNGAARRNPMPAGSTLSFESVVLLAGNAYPASVPSVAPSCTGGFVSGDQGSVHTLAVVPDVATCVPGGSKSATASANLVVTTPHGATSLLPVVLHYSVQ